MSDYQKILFEKGSLLNAIQYYTP